MSFSHASDYVIVIGDNRTEAETTTPGAGTDTPGAGTNTPGAGTKPPATQVTPTDKAVYRKRQ